MTKMTMKEFYNTVKVMADATEEMIAICDKQIAALDAKAEKAKAKRAEKKAEGDALTDVVKSLLTDELQLSDAIAAQIVGEDGEAISRQKVDYRLRTLVANGIAVKEDVKVEKADGKTSKRVAYRLA
jgi:hypothetical protein